MYSALRKGLSFKAAMGNTIVLTPPLNIEEEHLDSCVRVLDRCLRKSRISGNTSTHAKRRTRSFREAELAILRQSHHYIFPFDPPKFKVHSHVCDSIDLGIDA